MSENPLPKARSITDPLFLLECVDSTLARKLSLEEEEEELMSRADVVLPELLASLARIRLSIIQGRRDKTTEVPDTLAVNGRRHVVLKVFKDGSARTLIDGSGRLWRYKKMLVENSLIATLKGEPRWRDGSEYHAVAWETLAGDTRRSLTRAALRKLRACIEQVERDNESLAERVGSYEEMISAREKKPTARGAGTLAP